MEKKVNIILSAVEVIGIVLFLWLIPAETGTQIVLKTLLVLAWFAVFFFIRKKFKFK